MEPNPHTSVNVVPPPLITVRKACELLDCSMTTFETLVKSGRLHVVRLTGPRGDRRVRLEEVVELRNRWSDRAPADDVVA